MNLSRVKWTQWDKTQSRELLVCSYVCASHCAQLLHTILHRTDLIIFPLTLQTITTAPMMSIWGKGGKQEQRHWTLWDGKCTGQQMTTIQVTLLNVIKLNTLVRLVEQIWHWTHDKRQPVTEIITQKQDKNMDITDATEMSQYSDKFRTIVKPHCHHTRRTRNQKKARLVLVALSDWHQYCQRNGQAAAGPTTQYSYTSSCWVYLQRVPLIPTMQIFSIPNYTVSR